MGKFAFLGTLAFSQTGKFAYRSVAFASRGINTWAGSEWHQNAPVSVIC